MPQNASIGLIHKMPCNAWNLRIELFINSSDFFLVVLNKRILFRIDKACLKKEFPQGSGSTRFDI